MSDYSVNSFQTIDLLVADLLGIYRGKRVDVSDLEKILSGGMNLPASVFALDVNGDTVEETGLGYDHGDGDRLCLPVDGIVRPSPWVENRGYVLMSMHEHDRTPFFADPRHVLSQVIETFVATTGLHATVAVELEFYLLDQERPAVDSVQAPIAPGTGRRDQATQVYSLEDIDNYSDFLQSVREACVQQCVPASSAVAEYAPAQFEVNLHHQTDILQACDNALLLKRTIREVAKQHEFIATFMPKPFIDRPGSGMHIHISLQNDGENNALADESLLRHSVAGLLDTMIESTLIFAPTINAYRRLQPFMYAPTAPCWGYDNRSTAIRIPSGGTSSRRIEHRVAGADANPYLLVATLLAGIQYGLANGLSAPEPVSGNAYEQLPHQWPKTLASAVDAFTQGKYAHKALGEKFSLVYAACRSADSDLFQRSLTRTEFDWYLGI